jgi:hypothetical protein
MILTDKDARTLEANTKFKQVEMNENFFNVNLKETLTQEAPEMRPDTPDPEAQISLFEARKLNEQHISTVK